jgi:hypothetical protein
VIDAGFPTGATNQPNIELLKNALKSNKLVHSLRNREQSDRLFGTSSNKFVYSHDFFELISAVKKAEKA